MPLIGEFPFGRNTLLVGSQTTLLFLLMIQGLIYILTSAWYIVALIHGTLLLSFFRLSEARALDDLHLSMYTFDAYGTGLEWSNL